MALLGRLLETDGLDGIVESAAGELLHGSTASTSFALTAWVAPTERALSSLAASKSTAMIGAHRHQVALPGTGRHYPAHNAGRFVHQGG